MEQAGRFAVDGCSAVAVEQEGTEIEVVAADCQLEDEWRHAYDDRKDRW